MQGCANGGEAGIARAISATSRLGGRTLPPFRGPGADPAARATAPPVERRYGHGHDFVRRGGYEEHLRGHLRHPFIAWVRDIESSGVEHDVVGNGRCGLYLLQLAIPTPVRIAECGEVGGHSDLEFWHIGF